MEEKTRFWNVFNDMWPTLIELHTAVYYILSFITRSVKRSILWRIIHEFACSLRKSLEPDKTQALSDGLFFIISINYVAGLWGFILNGRYRFENTLLTFDVLQYFTSKPRKINRKSLNTITLRTYCVFNLCIPIYYLTIENANIFHLFGTLKIIIENLFFLQSNTIQLTNCSGLNKISNK